VVEIYTAENQVLSCNFGADPSFMKRIVLLEANAEVDKHTDRGDTTIQLARDSGSDVVGSRNTGTMDGR